MTEMTIEREKKCEYSSELEWEKASNLNLKKNCIKQEEKQTSSMKKKNERFPKNKQL